MKTDDVPEILSFTAQPLDWRGKLYQSITLGLGFDLLTGRVLPKHVTWGAAMNALEGGGCIDTGLPKKEAEWLLAGKACAPSGNKVKSLVVDMRVGTASRRLLVEGGEPFAALPLTWENTWGTEQENPQGLPPAQVQRAPVTDADSPFGTPACPGSRGAWPCRMARMGTYDAAWLSNRWPGVPDDFDWAFYNLAQPCQRLPQGLRGDEEFELTGLHPREQRLFGRLPGKTLRLFVRRQGQWRELSTQPDTVWLFPNQLTGLVLWHAMAECADESGSDVEAVRVELTPEDIVSKDASPKDTSSQASDLQAPRSQAVQADASKPEPSASVPASALAAASVGGAAAAAHSFPVPPASAPQPPVDYKAQFSAALNNNLADINAGLTEAGLPPLTSEQVEATSNKLNAIAEQIQAMEAQIEAQQASASEPQLADVLRQVGMSESDIKNIQGALDLPQPDPSLCRTPEEWHATIEKYLGLFAGFMHPSEKALNSMRTLLRLQGPGSEQLTKKLLDTSSSPTDVLVKAGMSSDKAAKFLEILNSDMPSDPAGMKGYAKKLEEAGGFPPGSITSKMEAYHTALQKMGFAMPAAPQTDTAKPKVTKETPPPPPQENAEEVTPPKPPTDRESVIAWLVAGKSLAGLNLAGIDLSGLDLSKQDMHNVDLSCGSLADSRLEGANLSGARLAGTDCTNAVFTDATLIGATLTDAVADRALFLRTNLTSTDATGIKAKDADFSQTVLDKVVLAKGSFVDATFHQAVGESCDASQATFTNAQLLFCQMPNAVFTDARFTGADVHECVLDKADFRNAVLDKSSFCYGTSVVGADLTGASLQDGVFTQIHAAGALFTCCRAAGASFNDSDYTAAVFRGADLRQGDFSRCTLNGADMEGVNLFKGSLREAKLSAVNVRNANLYGVDMTRITTDLATTFEGADMTNTILAAREATR